MNTIKLLLALALTTSISAVAQHSSSHESCKEMDVKSISQQDTNKDGAVSLDEYTAAEKLNAIAMFKHIDANGDGKLDAAEQKEIDEVMNNMRGTNATSTKKSKPDISI